jgi:hypothetical protein
VPAGTINSIGLVGSQAACAGADANAIAEKPIATPVTNLFLMLENFVFTLLSPVVKDFHRIELFKVLQSSGYDRHPKWVNLS